jgi:hypothetical protein
MAETRLNCEDYEHALTTLRIVIAACMRTLPMTTHDRYTLLHAIADDYLSEDLQEYEKERTHV